MRKKKCTKVLSLIKARQNDSKQFCKINFKHLIDLNEVLWRILETHFKAYAKVIQIRWRLELQMYEHYNFYCYR